MSCRAAHGTPSTQRLDPTREPEQRELAPGAAPVLLTAGRSRWLLTPLAQYRITARVLGRERYFLDWQSDFSPLDLALGWGLLADTAVDRYIDWSQAGRWYFYYWSGDSPYQNEQIVPLSANVHVIAANTNVRRALLALERDQIARLEGALVRVQEDGGAPDRSWSSSLSRSDVGGGSCEIMFVERVVSGGLEFW